MKNLMKYAEVNINKSFLHFRISFLALFATALLIGSFISLNANAQVRLNVHINVPLWAPHYDNIEQVRYYYLPDIECYYDVWNNEFVYLDDGDWMFANALPASYAWFDLNNCFAVVLDYRVHEPWRHFHYYVAHYPRYYYRTVYRDTYNASVHPVRGFNENGKNMVYGNDAGKVENARQIHTVPDRKVESIHEPVRMDYYGKDIGRPVKVQRNMMKPRSR